MWIRIIITEKRKLNIIKLIIITVRKNGKDVDRNRIVKITLICKIINKRKIIINIRCISNI